jgi:hypothetical protein
MTLDQVQAAHIALIEAEGRELVRLIENYVRDFPARVPHHGEPPAAALASSISRAILTAAKADGMGGCLLCQG